MSKLFSPLRWLMVACLLLSALLISVQPAFATSIDDDGKISSTETIDDDVLLSAQTVSMDGTVNGIVFAFGNEITINGTINGDLIAAASTITISPTARIKGNVFAGGQTINIQGAVEGSVLVGGTTLNLGYKATVNRNVYFGGYSFEAQSDTVINKDFNASVYQATLSGNIKGNANIDAGAIEIKGRIGGNANLKVEGPSNESTPFFPTFGVPIPPPLPSGLRISPDAQIGGQLTYTSPVEQTANIQSQPKGGTVFQTPAPEEGSSPKTPAPSITYRIPFLGWLFEFLRKLITLLLLGALVIWLLPNLLQKAATFLRSKPLPSLGMGAASLVVGYGGAILVGILLLALSFLLSLMTLESLSRIVSSVGFSSLGVLVVFLWLLVSFGSKLVVSYLIGDLLIEKLAPSANNRKVWVLLSGVLLYTLIASLPIFGWLIVFLATLFGLGALWFLGRSYWTKKGLTA
jgi:cytoskeletal protein CcmA (bactofilin family)